MNNVNRFAICAVALILAILSPVKLVWSADENASVAQVYLEFDPATGEFKSVPATPDNSPDGNMVMNSGTHQSTQTATEGVATQQTAQTGVTTDTAANAQQGGNTPVILGAVIALVVVGGIVLMTRKKPA